MYHNTIDSALAVYRATSIRTGWKANVFSPWQDYLPRLEKMMDDVEATVRQIDTIEGLSLLGFLHYLGPF